MLLGLGIALTGHLTGVRWLKIGGLVWAGVAAAQIAYFLATRQASAGADGGSAKILPFPGAVV
jgi:hypothetical protein